MYFSQLLFGLTGLLGLATAQTGTKSAPWTMTTAASGDLTVTLAQDLKDSWTLSANILCGTIRTKLARRELPACSLDFADSAIDSFERLGYSLSNAPVLPGITANDIAALAAQGVKLARYPATYEILAVYAIYSLRTYIPPKGEIALTFGVPAADVAKPTATPCPPLNTDKPSVRICEDPDNCKGNDKDLCQVGTYKDCSCVHAGSVTQHSAWMDLDAQNNVLSDLLRASNSAPDFSQGSVQCGLIGLSMDPSILKRMATKACENFNYTRSSSALYAGADLNPPTTISSGNEGNFEFYKTDSEIECSVQDCQDTYTKILNTCQFNSHLFTGKGSVTNTCGSWILEVASKRGPTDCSGLTEDGNRECEKQCGKPGSTCTANRLAKVLNVCACKA